MNTSAEIETALGFPAGSVTFKDTATGARRALAGGDEVVIRCSLWALRCIIKRRNLDAAIDAGIAALGTNQQTAAWAQWNYAGNGLHRRDVLVKQIRAWCGYNERQMDVLFAAAVAVEALR